MKGEYNMAKNLYDVVIDHANYMEHYEENIKAETEKMEREIQWPELDTQKLEFGIAAALCNRDNCVIVASNE